MEYDSMPYSFRTNKPATIDDVISSINALEMKLNSIELALEDFENLTSRDEFTGAPIIDTIKAHAHSADHGIWHIKELIEANTTRSIYPIIHTILLAIIAWRLF